MRQTLFALPLALLAVAVSDGSAREGADGEAQPRRRFVRVPAPDGIQIRRYNETDGRQPGKKSRVVVHYHGTLEDGTVFDSSVERGFPAPFRLNAVVPCWTEALTRMHVGEKAQITCPPATAYGWKGKPPRIPPNATLVFEIELIGVH